MSAAKTIPKTAILGQRGVNLVERIVLGMGCVWHPTTGGLEAGIDGHIELCDPVTAQALNHWVPVQVKARSSFLNETATSFDFVCDERDLEYWLHGSAKVLLVICRVDSSEAYCVFVNDCFDSPENAAEHKVHFDKTKNRFDNTCLPSLIEGSTPREMGFYMAPLPRPEKLFSNLLHVDFFPQTVHVAETSIRSPEEMKNELRRLGGPRGPEWLLKNRRLWSFWDLAEYPWNQLVDIGTHEELGTNEWIDSAHPATQNDFVQLLSYCLRGLIGRRADYEPKQRYFYFPPSNTLSDSRFQYTWKRRSSALTVFKAYTSKTDPQRVTYCRHMAMIPRFVKLDGEWYLEITPTYHFTWDGERPDRFEQKHIARIKQIDHHPRVFSQVLLWSSLLRAGTLTRFPYRFLRFGDLISLDSPVGIDDDRWMPGEEPEVRQELQAEVRQMRLV